MSIRDWLATSAAQPSTIGIKSSKSRRPKKSLSPVLAHGELRGNEEKSRDNYIRDSRIANVFLSVRDYPVYKRDQAYTKEEDP
jgi:hypothetical protein